MKKIFALVLALAMVLSLAAYGGDPSATPTDPNTPNGTDGPSGTNPPAATNPPVDPSTISKFTESPYITNLGIYGNVEDRLPVKDDI